MDHYPSIAQCQQIASDLGFLATSNWKYFEEPNCRWCGGPGWFWVLLSNRGVGVVACDDCRAGKNQQRAPKPAITHTIKSVPDAIWLCAGSDNPNRAVKAFETSWEMQDAERSSSG